MYQITQIPDYAVQNRILVLYDGSSLSLSMTFRRSQVGWFADLEYGTTFTIKGLRIVNSPNLLHQWRNLIPFGLACYSTANREPTQLQDFSSGDSKLYLLNATEVQAYTDLLSA